jgi:hypothetical protein
MRLLFIAAIVKVAVGIVASVFVLEPALPAPALPSWYYLFLLTTFGLAAAWLYFGGRTDPRAQTLGTLFALFAALFTDRVALRAIAVTPELIGHALKAIESVHLIAFCPYVFWRFAWSFPRVRPSLLPRGAAAAVEYAALVTGIVLVFGNVIAAVPAVRSTEVGAALGALSPRDDRVFWQAVSLLTIPSLALLILKSRRASLDERRRLKWVVAGVVAGNLPMVAHVLLAATVPRYAEFAVHPETSRALGITLTMFALLIPLATAYAVLVDQVLDVSFVVRQAVQYAFARYTVAAVLPLLVIAAGGVVYRNRTRPLGEILAGSPVAVTLIVLLGLVLVSRRALLRAIDRRFFRDQYDAQQILVDLAEQSHRLAGVGDVIGLLVRDADRALHLERVSLLLINPTGETLSDPQGRVRALPIDGPLGMLLSGSRAPLDVDLSSAGSALSRLPESEREWLVDAGARLLVPLFGVRETPIGLIVLGDKRSELPFTHEDKRLMSAVAVSTALALEQRLGRESPDLDTPGFSRSHAAQCGVCGRVQPRSGQRCVACSGPMHEARLPMVLAGKFEVEQQIGAGGMGVVYRGRDLHLNRPVALKVLPRLGTTAAARMRREARAMAAMQHPNLAVIHVMESWRGAPVLVLEYLAGGTLATRIRRGPIPVDEVLSISVVMAEVLRHVHAAGYLHRDVKPSNIGFTFDGNAKLLDFGLAQMIADVSEAPPTINVLPAAATADSLTVEVPTAFSTGRHLIGTPAYMSPEAILAEPVTPAIDLWSLAVTMYEALTGTQPFRAPTMAATLTLVMVGEVRDVRVTRPDCPPAIAEFLASALSRIRQQRPQTASEFLHRLAAARAAVG